MESSLRQVEIATGAITSKKGSKFRSATNGRAGRSQAPDPDDNVQSPRGHPQNGKNTETDGTDMDASIRKGGASRKSATDAMEQAQVLRAELERVQSGIRLLGDSVERLNDAVRSDNKWCGGVVNAMCTSLCLQLWAFGGSRGQQGVYSTVSMDESVHSQL